MLNGVQTKVHLHPDGSFTIQRITPDVEPVLDNNKRLQNEPQRRGSFKHVGSIPLVVIEKWIKDDGVLVLSMTKEEFARYIRRKLNDPDNRHLKTTDGRL